MFLEAEDTVIVSDLHAHVGKIELLEEHYPGVRKIITGDSVDGENTARFLQAAGEIGALLAWGNHEWVLSAVLQAKNQFEHEQYANRWRHNDSQYNTYEHNLLKSYGVAERQSNQQAIERLYKIMWRSGHLDLLNSAQLYYETPDFIGIHAGITRQPWSEQCAELDAIKLQTDQFDYSNPPIQIFDEYVAGFGYALADTKDDFEATDKIVISGHSHINASEAERVSASGRRVRLASRLAIGAKMYVWQSWDQQVVAI